MKAKTLDRLLTTTCVFGILVSTYALYVEMAIETQPGFKALCDISEHASCSKVLSSEYGKGFGVIQKDSSFQLPNCIYGIIFYCIMILMTTFDNIYIVRLQFIQCVVSIFMCIYLAYLLAFVLYDFCIVCVSTYIINGVLTFLIYKKMCFFTRKLQ